MQCTKYHPDDRCLPLAELFAERSGTRPLTILVAITGAHPRLLALIHRNAHRGSVVAKVDMTSTIRPLTATIMSSPINSLSTELLLEIFLYLHDRTHSHQKLRSSFLSQVCTSWRQAAFLAQELWSVIVIWCKKYDPNDRRLSLAELFAERSGDRPLTIVVHSAAAHPRLIALICNNAHRVQSLRLYTNSSSIFISLGGKAFPTLQHCRVLLPTPIWPETALKVAFPNRLCTSLSKLTLSGGLQPSNFDLACDKIRQLDVSLNTTNAFSDPRADTIPVQLFEALPLLETLSIVLLDRSFGSGLFQSPFRWPTRSAVEQHDLVAFRLICNSAQLQWIPELPRLQRLHLEVINSLQHDVTFNPNILLSFFQRAGRQIEFLDLYVEEEIIRQHPNIWEGLLPLIPKVRAFRTLALQDGSMEILLDHRITKPRLLPYLHTLRLRFPWFTSSDQPNIWTLDALLAMLRSRGWVEDDDPNFTLAETHLRAVVVMVNSLKKQLGVGGVTRLEDWQARLRSWHGGRFVLQVSDIFDWSDPEVIGGSLFVG